RFLRPGRRHITADRSGCHVLPLRDLIGLPIDRFLGPSPWRGPTRFICLSGRPESSRRRPTMSDSNRTTFRPLTVLLVAAARLRFLVILGLIGLVIVKWDELMARYEQWTRPTDATGVDPDHEYFCPMHPQIVRPDNKEKCPICFMPLSKRKV